MGNFVWVIDAAKSEQFGLDGVSDSYILPGVTLKKYSSQLLSKRIWVILRGDADRLFIALTVKSIDGITDGYYAGDYILKIDLCSSIKLANNFIEAERYETKIAETTPNGISPISTDLDNALILLVKNSVKVKLISPKVNELKNLHLALEPKTNPILARELTRTIISNFSLDQMWKLSAGAKITGAVPHFASVLLSSCTNEHLTDDLERCLSDLDPINKFCIGIETRNKYKRSTTSPDMPNVDLDFTIIDPQKIFTRKFIRSNSKTFDPRAAMEKTEKAEAKHQEILTDVTTFLISNKITAYESNSIDLMYKTNSNIYAFEIKSANQDNIVAQSAKGAFQLSYYLDALNCNFDKVSTYLIIEKIGNDALEDFVTRTLNIMNINVLFYDETKLWPNKIMGLPI
jgi:hypothetical protein